MKWMAPAIALLSSCTYYGSHKILLQGEEPEQRHEYEDRKKQLEVEMSPGPQYFPYIEGAGKEVMACVKVNADDVPSTITVEAIGHNAHVGDITILARYLGGPDHSKNSYSDILATKKDLRQIASDEGAVMFEFKGLFNHQPRKPDRIEVWFKVITHFKSTSDTADVWVSFNGDRVGGQKVDYSQASPKD